MTAVVVLFAVVGMAVLRDDQTSISSQAVPPPPVAETTTPGTSIPDMNIPETTIPLEAGSKSDPLQETTIPEAVEVCSTNLGCQSVGISPTTVAFDCSRVVGEHAPGFFSTVMSPCPDPLPDVTICTAALDNDGQPIEDKRHCLRQYDRLPSTSVDD